MALLIDLRRAVGCSISRTFTQLDSWRSAERSLSRKPCRQRGTRLPSSSLVWKTRS
jgi:hypothetical protein